MVYGVEFDGPVSLENSGTVIVPDIEVPQSCFANLQANIDPLHSTADTDHGINCYCHALQILNQTIDNN